MLSMPSCNSWLAMLLSLQVSGALFHHGEDKYGGECCRFFYFFLIMFLVHQTAMTIFRAIGVVLRAVVLANVGAFLFIGCALLWNGFIIQKGQ